MKKTYISFGICGALACIAVKAQTPTILPPSSRPITQEPTLGQRRDERPPDPEEVKRQKEREKAMNKERFSALKQDTDKLLQLATELKQSVDATTENKLSLEVIRKTEEIEKLAKKVRDKMKS
ncbi:MAG: hypothetical protein JWO13_2048 [Acidobacteriales bacterium]|nr:hypothetical protein [Terriglobales bacterium]